MKLSEKGTLVLIQREGLKTDAYPDPKTKSDPWTIGVGHTGPEVKKGLKWTVEHCHLVFSQDIAKYETAVSRGIGNALTNQDQFDAMVSFAFNEGIHAFSASTLLKKHNAGDYEGAKAEFERWDKDNKSLNNRRKAEAYQYSGGLNHGTV